MVWAWLERNRNRLRWKRTGGIESLDTTFVPHAEWSQWLAAGQWDRAAVLLEQLRQKPSDSTVKLLLPDWERRLTDAFLAAGWADLNRATALRWLRRVDRFPDRGLQDPRLETFREAADRLWELERACVAGDFRDAMNHLDRARQLIVDAGQDDQALVRMRERIAEDHETLLQCTVAMRILEDDGRYEESLAVARRILAIAPRHKGAQALAKRLGNLAPSLIRADFSGLVTEIPRGADDALPLVEAQTATQESPAATSTTPARIDIGQISLDRADTWLVCQEDAIVVATSDDARFADLFGTAEASGLRLQRDSEGCWMFTSDSGVFVDGKTQRSGCLFHGNLLRLNEKGTEFRFVQPRMETGTARLERTGRPSAKGVRGLVLLGEMLQIGGPDAEVPHKEITEPLILARSADGWAVKRRKSWTLEGQEIAGDASLKPPCRMRVGAVGIFWEC